MKKHNKTKDLKKQITAFFSKISKKSWFKWVLRLIVLSIMTSFMLIIVDHKTLWFQGKEVMEAGLGLFIITAYLVIMGLYDSLEKAKIELEKEFGPAPKEKSLLEMLYELS